MAIRKRVRKGGIRYQVLIRGTDNQWVSRTFLTRKEAEAFETHLKREKFSGGAVSNVQNKITLNQYFVEWFESVRHQASEGHRHGQHQLYKDYVVPVIGSKRLEKITPKDVADILNRMAKAGKSAQTRQHVFNLLRKMFGDAVEMFRLLNFNPALKKLKPKIPKIERPHLSVTQLKKLLKYVDDKEYRVPIWLQLVLGLRIGEVQALKWEDVDFERGVLHIRRTYCRKDSWVLKEPVFRNYPKNRKHRSHRTPVELMQILRRKKLESVSEFVAATSYEGGMLSYEFYHRTLKRYCREIGIPEVGTHGLRHSTAGIYVEHGATREDVAQLLDNPSAVDRYFHTNGKNVDRIADVIRLFPEGMLPKCCPEGGDSGRS